MTRYLRKVTLACIVQTTVFLIAKTIKLASDNTAMSNDFCIEIITTESGD